MRYLGVCLVILCFLWSKNSFCQNTGVPKEVTFLFYNTENFFDCEDDSLTNDDEFTPVGDRKWKPQRFYDKADRLAKVILAAGKWNAPVFVGLCEVENLSVLEVLTKATALDKFHYKIIHKDSPDERGIDVAVIYRSEIFKPFDYAAIPVIDSSDPTFRTRDILRVSGVLFGCDTIDVFISHWPSRYGGMMETLKHRKLAAEVLNGEIMKLRSSSPGVKLVCMGDFNDTPEDESLTKVLGAQEVDDPDVFGELINLSTKWKGWPVQTIKSRQIWETFDQVIVSDSFFKRSDCLEIIEADIFRPDFLLEPDRSFGGVKPRRSYVGYKYQEGFSDHLPVLLRMKVKSQ